MRRQRHAATWLLLLGVAALLAVALPALAEERHEKVSFRVAAEIERAGSARVFVRFATSKAKSARSSRARHALDRIAGERGIRVRHRLERLHAAALIVDVHGLQRLRSDPDVAEVVIDPPARRHLLESLPLAGLDAARALGVDGRGITVAVIDSGVDGSHPDLQGAVVGEQCFCFDFGAGCCPDGGTQQSGPGSAADGSGHGTLVAGALAGRGSQAPAGAAPSAELVAVRVLDDRGESCCLSDSLAALEWILAERSDVDLVNMSLGSLDLFAGDCDDEAPWTRAFADSIGALRDRGVLTIASSGNEGSSTRMAAPACISSAIAVGAVWDEAVGPVRVEGCSDLSAADRVACYSNSSATTDLVAPGGPARVATAGGGTAEFIGTSLSAPLVTGCAALLREAQPSVGADELEVALETSDSFPVDPKNGRALPRLACELALASFLCGDGALAAGEECDDGNSLGGDGCDGACRVERGAACSGAPSECFFSCGDARLDPGEACDDGNLTAGDGCDDRCRSESGWGCSGEPSSCALLCGDGVLDPGEACDDGSVGAGDGCDASCRVEPGWLCQNEPSLCQEIVAAPTPAQRRCLVQRSRRASLLTRDQGRASLSCARNHAADRRGRLGDPATASACPQNDVDGLVAKRRSQLFAQDAKLCLSHPSQRPAWAYGDTGMAADAAQAASLDLLRDVFGPDLDAGWQTIASARRAARCQAEVLRRSQAVLDDLWKRSLKASKIALSESSGPVATLRELELFTLGYLAEDSARRGERTLAKLVGKVEKRCFDPVLEQPLSALLPGRCSAATSSGSAVSACLERAARCRFCQALNAGDHLSLDCDLFDDGTPDDSCS